MSVGYQVFEEWMYDGVCGSVDPELWFPPSVAASGPAKRICNGSKSSPACPVRAQCLEFALRSDERFGIWGGLTERERRKLKRG